MLRAVLALLAATLAAFAGLGLACLWAGGTGCASRAPAAPGNPDPLASAPAALLLERGRAFAAAGDTIRAEQYLVAAMRRGAEDHKVAPVLIGTCIRGQRYRAALAHTERFVRRHPRVAVTVAAVAAGFALSWPLKSVAEPPQAKVIPGVMASEISDEVNPLELSN